MPDASPPARNPPAGIHPEGWAGVVAVLERSSAQGIIGGDLEDHIAHALAFAAEWSDSLPPATMADLGSGGGLPAMVLAANWPDATVLLTETRRKRADLLERGRRALNWQDRLTVWAGDVQDAVADGYREWAQLVTARAFGPPAMVAECAAPLLTIGGRLIVSEPPDSHDRWPDAELKLLGLTRGERSQQGPYRFAVLDKTGPTPPEFPRRRRTMERSPLWH